MIWQVCISENGVEQQLCLGDNDRIAKEQESYLHSFDKTRIKLLFTGTNPQYLKGDYWYKNFSKENYEEKIEKELSEIAARHGSIGFYSMHKGYEVRKSTLGDYIEVLTDLEADNYDEFHSLYPGLEGAINILYNSTAVLHGASASPAKAIMRMVKKIQLEISEKEDEI